MWRLLQAWSVNAREQIARNGGGLWLCGCSPVQLASRPPALVCVLQLEVHAVREPLMRLRSDLDDSSELTATAAMHQQRSPTAVLVVAKMYLKLRLIVI